MANVAFFDSAWIITTDRIQAIGTPMFFDHGKLDFRFGLEETFLLRAQDRFHGLDHPTASVIGADARL
jgi:hypothetical protein